MAPAKPSAHALLEPNSPFEFGKLHLAGKQFPLHLLPDHVIAPVKLSAHAHWSPSSPFELGTSQEALLQSPIGLGPFQVILPEKPSSHAHAGPGALFEFGMWHGAGLKVHLYPSVQWNLDGVANSCGCMSLVA